MARDRATTHELAGIGIDALVVQLYVCSRRNIHQEPIRVRDIIAAPQFAGAGADEAAGGEHDRYQGCGMMGRMAISPVWFSEDDRYQGVGPA